EGAIANVYVGSGPDDLRTPPLASGALPGFLRAELLERGLAREAVVTEAELRAAPLVLISSSVRGLRRVSVTPGVVGGRVAGGKVPTAPTSARTEERGVG